MKRQFERVRTSLEIEDDINLHITGWIIQRVGWGLMLAFLACAGLGLFGTGILSGETLAREATTVRFEQYSRRDNDAEIGIRAPQSGGVVRVVLSPAFLEAHKVEKIVPEPAAQSADLAAAVYEFKTEAAGDITFFLTTRKAGRFSSTIRVNDDLFELKQLIYP